MSENYERIPSNERLPAVDDPSVPSQPRTSGEVADSPTVQAGLVLLLVMLGLLVLWVVSSVINAA